MDNPKGNYKIESQISIKTFIFINILIKKILIEKNNN